MKKYLEVTIPRRGKALWTACGFMTAAALVRLGYYLPREMDAMTFWVHLVMPVAAAVIFLAGIVLGGRWAKAAGITAVVVGVVFFVIKATTFTPIHQTLCTILYLAVLSLFTMTLLGLLPTKKLLYPLFGLPLLYHLLVEDTQAYFFADPPVPVAEWMPEISVLCIMAALLSLSVSLEARRISS
ncbi:MAG: hypothetical protein J6J18_08285 [Oscillospiraceae bacterium]|nr:hypothetical protein [Oscillospiraceae bacterium]